jgi:hypothetical protein
MSAAGVGSAGMDAVVMPGIGLVMAAVRRGVTGRRLDPVRVPAVRVATPPRPVVAGAAGLAVVRLPAEAGFAVVGLAVVGLAAAGRAVVAFAAAARRGATTRSAVAFRTGFAVLAGLAAIGLAAIGLAATDLAAIGLAAIGLAAIGLAAIGLAAIGLAAIGLAADRMPALAAAGLVADPRAGFADDVEEADERVLAAAVRLGVLGLGTVGRVVVVVRTTVDLALARATVEAEGFAPERAGDLVGAFLAAAIRVFLLANDCGLVSAWRLRNPAWPQGVGAGAS